MLKVIIKKDNVETTIRNVIDVYFYLDGDKNTGAYVSCRYQTNAAFRYFHCYEKPDSVCVEGEK